MNLKDLAYDIGPDTTSIHPASGEPDWLSSYDYRNNPYDDHANGYGADIGDSDDDDSDEEDCILTFPYPWLSKLVVTYDGSPEAIIHKKPVERVVTHNDEPTAVFYHRYSSIIEHKAIDTDSVNSISNITPEVPLKLELTPTAPSEPSTALDHHVDSVVPFTVEESSAERGNVTDPDHSHITINDTFDDSVCIIPSHEHPQAENVPTHTYSDDDGYPESVISLSSGEDSVICLSSDSEDSDCDSVISVSSTESDSVIFVTSTTLKQPKPKRPREERPKRPREEPKPSKKIKQDRPTKRTKVRYDHRLDASTTVSYKSPDSTASYFAVKRSKYPGIFSCYSVALNHCRGPEDVHHFPTLGHAEYFMGPRAIYHPSTQRQHLSPRGDPIFDVFTDGSSKTYSSGTTLGGFGVWFGQYHPDNVAGALDGEMQTALQAELRAILEAYKVLYNRHDQHMYTIYCDCVPLVRKLNAGRGIPPEYHATVTSIQLYKNLLGPKVRLDHILGHAGHPGNERADILAKMGRSARSGSIPYLNTVLEARFKRAIKKDFVEKSMAETDFMEPHPQYL
ncbi:hypothetical protein CJU89_2246 [Yarrowia sp. B02]|nr:hypothetical protein CJU89_2246 [Yarrowia sp. B02]